MGIHFLNWTVWNIIIIKLSGFAKMFIFNTQAPQALDSGLPPIQEDNHGVIIFIPSTSA